LHKTPLDESEKKGEGRGGSQHMYHPKKEMGQRDRAYRERKKEALDCSLLNNEGKGEGAISLTITFHKLEKEKKEPILSSKRCR